MHMHAACAPFLIYYTNQSGIQSGASSRATHGTRAAKREATSRGSVLGLGLVR